MCMCVYTCMCIGIIIVYIVAVRQPIDNINVHGLVHNGVV